MVHHVPLVTKQSTVREWKNFQVSSELLWPEMCGVPTRQWKDIIHQDLATFRGWHCSTTSILIKLLSSKRTNFIYIDQSPNLTAGMSLNLSHVTPCQRQPRQSMPVVLSAEGKK